MKFIKPLVAFTLLTHTMQKSFEKENDLNEKLADLDENIDNKIYKFNSYIPKDLIIDAYFPNGYTEITPNGIRKVTRENILKERKEKIIKEREIEKQREENEKKQYCPKISEDLTNCDNVYKEYKKKQNKEFNLMNQRSELMQEEMKLILDKEDNEKINNVDKRLHKIKQSIDKINEEQKQLLNCMKDCVENKQFYEEKFRKDCINNKMEKIFVNSLPPQQQNEIQGNKDYQTMDFNIVYKNNAKKEAERACYQYEKYSKDSNLREIQYENIKTYEDIKQILKTK